VFAVLRAGSEHAWGVGVVLGAGINCVGVAPDGREVRFPALGELWGDWGGGRDVGRAAVGAALRGEDGRGPRTSLTRVVAGHFGLGSAPAVGAAPFCRAPARRGAPWPRGVAGPFGVGSALAVVEALFCGQLDRRRVLELVPLVFAEAGAGDPAAAALGEPQVAGGGARGPPRL